MSQYNVVMSTSECTVLAEYERQEKRYGTYQSEAELEATFIKMLKEQGYEYLNIHNENELILNLRKQLERLNDFQFADEEWDRFFKEKLANSNEGIAEKTRKIQEDYVQPFVRVVTNSNGQGTSSRSQNITKNIKLIDKSNVHNNQQSLASNQSV